MNDRKFYTAASLVDDDLIVRAAGTIGQGNQEARVRRMRSPILRSALIAAAMCVVLVGAALAASPTLREAIWGAFAPYAQDIAADEGAVSVYDGVEARLASAVSDGHMTVVHLEFRDLRGDRVGALYQEFGSELEVDLQMAVLEMRTADRVTLDRFPDTEPAPGYQSSVEQVFTRERPQILSYDGETGVLTVTFSVVMVVPEDFERTIIFKLAAGALDTEPGPEKSVGWTLEAPIEILPVRTVSVGGVEITAPAGGHTQIEEVDISAVCVTVKRGEVTAASEILSVEAVLADGSTVASQGNGYSKYAVDSHNYKESAAIESFVLERPVDPAEVVGIVFPDGTRISLK